MASWALIDENNIVVNVTRMDNDHPDGDEGYQWLVTNLGGRWIKTSINTMCGKHTMGGVPVRKNGASIGMTYREDLDAFIHPQPFPSWTLNEETGCWEPPIPYPSDFGYPLLWVEETQEWINPFIEEQP